MLVDRIASNLTNAYDNTFHNAKTYNFGDARRVMAKIIDNHYFWLWLNDKGKCIRRDCLI